jgi:hypothetical protein
MVRRLESAAFSHCVIGVDRVRGLGIRNEDRAGAEIKNWSIMPGEDEGDEEGNWLHAVSGAP